VERNVLNFASARNYDSSEILKLGSKLLISYGEKMTSILIDNVKKNVSYTISKTIQLNDRLVIMSVFFSIHLFYYLKIYLIQLNSHRFIFLKFKEFDTLGTPLPVGFISDSKLEKKIKNKLDMRKIMKGFFHDFNKEKHLNIVKISGFGHPSILHSSSKSLAINSRPLTGQAIFQTKENSFDMIHSTNHEIHKKLLVFFNWVRSSKMQLIEIKEKVKAPLFKFIAEKTLPFFHYLILYRVLIFSGALR